MSNGATVTYPDVNSSNVCLACHTGQETGDSIKLSTDPGTNLSFINSHYLTAGGQVFAKTGYTYAGRNYANVSFFKHDKIGTTQASGTGNSGPCVGCHMSSPNKHLFTNISSNTSGVIAKITSTMCVNCHSGQYALTPDVLIEEEEGYNAALDALAAVLGPKGILYLGDTYPYFFNDNNPTNGILDAAEISRTNGFKNWAGVYPSPAIWQDAMGAAFNLNLLGHDPGGYAHNSFYSKRLIYDSIDYIDDGILNYSVGATLDAASETVAKAYLLYNGTTTGTSAERPHE
jgi:hypothetical protein